MYNSILKNFPELDLPKLQARISSARQELINIAFWDKYRDILNGLPVPQNQIVRILHQAIVKVGEKSELPDSLHPIIEKAIEALIPWRKGPFELFGHHIDAEWRADLKWDRTVELLGPVEGRRVLDLGGNNGYYLFRLISMQPELALCLDPNGIFYHQFELMQRYLRIPNLVHEVLGADDLDLFPKFFDTIMCMGVIYHYRHPLQLLQLIHNALRPDGRLILESIVIPSDQPISLSPPERYAKMRNVWFIPSTPCLCSWLKMSGFKNIQVHSEITIGPEEQRQTKYAPWESLKDFLDPNDDKKTIEGYPAPLRATVTAHKRGNN